MSLEIGGAVIKELDFTMAWGINPSSARIVAIGSPINPDTLVTLTLGGASFSGVVENCVTERSVQGGSLIHINFVDTRVFLQDEYVTAYFNGEEIVADNPTTPGIDRSRRYWHILPADWLEQKKTYTEQPLTARQICDYILEADTVTRSWVLNYTAAFARPVYDVDCLNGKKLNNVFAEIFDQLGVMCKPGSTDYSLEFGVKGVGSLPSIGSNASARSTGSARGYRTRLRIIGDRNVYQQVVNLEQDWKSAYEKFYFEAAWVQEVRSRLSIDSAAEAQARAQEITLREYAAIAGEEYIDTGYWNEISRMELPVIVYLREIVFKAYRIPQAVTVNGIPVQHTEIRDSLLVDVDVDDGGTMSPNGELYPSTQAVIIAKGAGTIDLADSRFEDGMTPEMVDNLANVWAPVGEFTIDKRTKTVFFSSPIVAIGSGSNALFIRPNNVNDDEDNQDELNNIVVPNANATISATEVRGVFAFEADRYVRNAGSGDRVELFHANGLCIHHDGTGEITYADGKGADEKADEIADRVLAEQRYLASGGFTRHGVAGMTLNGAIDRVNVSLRFESGSEDEGLVENVEFAKERGSPVFQPERQLTRLERTTELFPGQKALEEDTRRIRKLGRIKAGNVKARGRSVIDVMNKPLGNNDPALVFVAADSNTSYPAGMPVFAKTVVEDGGGVLTVDQGGRFVGCITTANLPAATGYPIPVATNGVVNCRVKGPFRRHQTVGVDQGGEYAWPNGTIPIGQVLQDYGGSEIILAKVRISAITPERIHMWKLIPTGDRKFRLTPGYVQFFGTTILAPSNMNEEFTCPPNNTTGYHYWLKATLSGDELPTPNELVIEAGDTLPVGNAGNPETGALPTITYCPLGYVTSTQDSLDPPVIGPDGPLTLDIVVQDVDCASQTRGLTWKSLSDGSVIA